MSITPGSFPASVCLSQQKETAMKVFIVEDSALVCERLIDMLSDLAEVEIVGQAQSPPEAIRGIRGLAPDVVILDIRLNGGSGIDVLAEVKESSASPIVIVLTSYFYPEYRKKCMGLGAGFFFDKSADFAKIPGVLQRLSEDSRICPRRNGREG